MQIGHAPDQEGALMQAASHSQQENNNGQKKVPHLQKKNANSMKYTQVNANVS